MPTVIDLDDAAGKWPLGGHTYVYVHRMGYHRMRRRAFVQGLLAMGFQLIVLKPPPDYPRNMALFRFVMDRRDGTVLVVDVARMATDHVGDKFSNIWAGSVRPTYHDWLSDRQLLGNGFIHKSIRSWSDVYRCLAIVSEAILL